MGIRYCGASPSAERMPLGDGFPGILEGAVPVDSVGVAADVLTEGHVTRMDVDGRRGWRQRGLGVAEARHDDQDDAVLPPVDADVQLEHLVELDAGAIVDRRRLALLHDASRFVQQQQTRH